MYLYTNDRKVLRAMKKAQCSENKFVAIDTNSNFHHAEFSESAHIEEAMQNKPISSKLPLHSIEASMQYLQKEGYIQRIGWSSPVYQVTHEGWFVSSAIRHELISMVATHFLFPSAVAFITTLLTLWLSSTGS